jgi:peroxiredoxin
VADEDRQLSEAVEVIHRNSNPQGGDTAAPTTLLIDGSGTVRWSFRPDLFLERLSPAQMLAAVDEHMPQDGSENQ